MDGPDGVGKGQQDRRRGSYPCRQLRDKGQGPGTMAKSAGGGEPLQPGFQDETRPEVFRGPKVWIDGPKSWLYTSSRQIHRGPSSPLPALE